MEVACGATSGFPRGPKAVVRLSRHAPRGTWRRAGRSGPRSRDGGTSDWTGYRTLPYAPSASADVVGPPKEPRVTRTLLPVVLALLVVPACPPPR
jgi:hypothetical protein